MEGGGGEGERGRGRPQGSKKTSEQKEEAKRKRDARKKKEDEQREKVAKENFVQAMAAGKPTQISAPSKPSHASSKVTQTPASSKMPHTTSLNPPLSARAASFFGGATTSTFAVVALLVQVRAACALCVRVCLLRAGRLSDHLLDRSRLIHLPLNCSSNPAYCCGNFRLAPHDSLFNLSVRLRTPRILRSPCSKFGYV